jgi:hypothetical protein
MILHPVKLASPEVALIWSWSPAHERVPPVVGEVAAIERVMGAVEAVTRPPL